MEVLEKGSAAELKPLLEELVRGLPQEAQSVEVPFPSILSRSMAAGSYLLENPSGFFGEAGEILRELAGREVELRIHGLPRTLYPGQVRAEHVGKFVQVEGVVVRASEVKPEVDRAAFRCALCGETMVVKQEGWELQFPSFCENPNCGKRGPFTLVEEGTTYSDWQGLRIQERPEVLRGGQTPTVLNAVARKDLVNRAFPGDQVVVTGVVRTLRVKRERVLLPVLVLNHLRRLDKTPEEMELSPGEVEEVKRLASLPNIYQLIVDSIAPEILGHRDLKEAIALQLFGSDPATVGNSRFRGDLHILICGDPGVAKSMLLLWASRVAPRACFVSGKKTTAGGLTAVVTRDELTKSWTLEAGAMVLADGGLVCVDEFDMLEEEDQSAMYEAMESQAISIHKAGIHARLNARTSVLAAANPKFGRWDPNRNVYEQLNVDPVLLSRFDLIFVLQDVPEEGRDRKLAEHLLRIRSHAEVKAPLSADQLRKLVAYARREVHPQVNSAEVRRMMEDYFVEWRKNTPPDAGPPTARQLEAIWRLSMASARMRFSQEVEREDVERATRLLSLFLQKVGVDVETGRLDMDIVQTGRARSLASRLGLLYDLLKKLEEKGGGEADEEELVREAEENGIPAPQARRLIEEEVTRGGFMRPRVGKITRVIKW